jgi:hypothetical protein
LESVASWNGGKAAGRTGAGAGRLRGVLRAGSGRERREERRGERAAASTGARRT